MGSSERVWDVGTRPKEHSANCAALAPDSAVGYAGLAESYLRTGKDLPKARTLAAKAVQLEPTAWNYFILAAICEKLDDRDGAASALKTAIALEPNNPRYRQFRPR